MELMAREDDLALIVSEQNDRVCALAKKLGYPGSTDLGALENSARDASEYLGKSIYALGTCLLLLKEGAPRGQFLPTLGRLGISPDSAQRYMAMSRRFANTATSRHLEKLGFSKMTELLPLDDEQIEELSGLGQTGELALDDVARMSVKELRAAVRKERAVKERLKTVNDELNTELATKKHIKKATPDQVLVELQKEATGIAHDAMGCVRGQLRQALIALKNHGDEDLSVFMAGLVGQVQADLTALRNEFALPDVSSAKDKELAAQVVQWAPKKAGA